MQHVPPLDVLIPIVLLVAAVGVHLWRSGSRGSAVLAAVALAVAVPLAAYFLAPRPIYHCTLIGCLIHG
jgi:hypothetical protein